MVNARILAISALLATAGCSGPLGGDRIAPEGVGPVRATGATPVIDQGAFEAPNSLPPGVLTQNPVAVGDGVIGVRHLAP